jgi:hypothetical protein
MKIIQQKQRGLNQISQNNKRTSCIFLLGQLVFLGEEREKRKKEKKHC